MIGPDFHASYGPGPILTTVLPGAIDRHVVHGMYGAVEAVVADRNAAQVATSVHLVVAWIDTAPFELRLVFTQPIGGRVTTWTVARTLIHDGDGGSGDIRITRHRTTTCVELTVPSGRARIEINGVWLADLIAETERIVPVACELDDVAAELSVLLAREAPEDGDAGSVWD